MMLLAIAAPATAGASDIWSLIFVFLLATFIGLGIIRRVSRLLHTPLMSLTNAISAIAVVGAILVAGPDYPTEIRVLGVIAVFASMTNIVSGFLITERILVSWLPERWQRIVGGSLALTSAAADSGADITASWQSSYHERHERYERYETDRGTFGPATGSPAPSPG